MPMIPWYEEEISKLTATNKKLVEENKKLREIKKEVEYMIEDIENDNCPKSSFRALKQILADITLGKDTPDKVSEKEE